MPIVVLLLKFVRKAGLFKFEHSQKYSVNHCATLGFHLCIQIYLKAYEITLVFYDKFIHKLLRLQITSPRIAWKSHY